jgi:hypothetical protein
VVTFTKDSRYNLLVKSWSSINPKPKAMNTNKLHRLDISRSVPRPLKKYSSVFLRSY